MPFKTKKHQADNTALSIRNVKKSEIMITSKETSRMKYEIESSQQEKTRSKIESKKHFIKTVVIPKTNESQPDKNRNIINTQISKAIIDKPKEEQKYSAWIELSVKEKHEKPK